MIGLGSLLLVGKPLAPLVVSAIAPDYGPEAGGTSVTITGTGFATATAVRIATSRGPTVVQNVTDVVIVDDNTITCTVPTRSIFVGYVHNVYVQRANGDSAALTNCWTYIPRPSVSSITPSTGFATGGTAITDLHGSNFVNGATVTIGGVAATSVVFVSSSKLTCVAPAVGSGTKDVVVTNPDTQTSGSSGDGLFTGVVAPTITSVTPSSGFAVGGTAITDLHGLDFQTGATVTIGGVAATSVVRVSASKLTCVAPAGTAGAQNVVVTNPDTQTSGTSGNGLYTYLAAPTVTAITPSSGPAAGATSITDLHGTGFVNGCTATIGGAAVTGLAFVSSVKLTCTTPAGSGGAQDVVVTNPDTQTSGSSGNGLFTYVAAPTVTAITPSSGFTALTTAITDLHGTGFVNGCTATIDGVPVTGLAFVSSVKLTCTTPTGSAGAKNVVVTNPDTQTSGSSGNGLFTYVGPPTGENPTAWWEGPYSGSPLTPTAGAGNSAGNGNLVTQTGLAAPTAGTTVNGVAPADFSGGSPQGLMSQANLVTAAGFTSALIGASCTLIVLAKAGPMTTATSAGTEYFDPSTLVDNGGYIGLSETSTGLRAWFYTSSTQVLGPYATGIVAGAWYFAALRLQSATAFRFRVNATHVTPLLSGGVRSGGGAKLFSGSNYGGGNPRKGQLMAAAVYDYAVSDAQLDTWYAYFKAKYPAMSLP